MLSGHDLVMENEENTELNYFICLFIFVCFQALKCKQILERF